MTTGGSWPWNLSTVPTRASGSRPRILATWLLYGATTSTSSAPIVDRAPEASTQPTPSSDRPRPPPPPRAGRPGPRAGGAPPVRGRRRRPRVVHEPDREPAGPPVDRDPLA